MKKSKVQRKFLADNGGEFANAYYRDMCENLNIEVLKTGSESPFQNGLCERNHCVVDGMLLKLLADEVFSCSNFAEEVRPGQMIE